MAEKKQPEPENEVVSKEKLAAWQRCRDIWKASGRPPHVTQELLDAEQEARDTP